MDVAIDDALARAEASLLGVLCLSPTREEIFRRAWLHAKDAASAEDLTRATFPADGDAKGATDRHGFGGGDVQQLAMLIGLVFTATRTLIVMCNKLANGQEAPNPLVELMKAAKTLGLGDADADAAVKAVTRAVEEPPVP